MANNALSGHFTTRRLLCFALPNLVMMVFLSLYTIVDGLFISRYVGTLALSAVNMSYPITSLELAIGIMLGTGGSAIVAKTLGEGDPVTARKNFTFIIVVSLVISVLFLILGLVFLDPLLLQLGTSEAQFPYCRICTQILLLFSPALFLQCLFQVLFVTAGEPRLGLYSTVGGGLCNMVLDWLFMGCWGMGVEGAAIATVISYCVPAVMGLVYFGLWRKGTLYFVKFRPDWKMLAYACGNGSSELVSNLANAITTLLFNLLFLAAWQEDGVAAITIVMYLQFVFSAAYMGFSIGVAPVISYKYGAEAILQLKSILKDCLWFIALSSIGAYLLSMILIRPALSFFTNPDSRVFQLAMDGFPTYAICFLFMGLSIFASAMFTALSNGIVSAVISFGRTFVFLALGLLLLPEWLGPVGLWISVPFAEFLGLLVSVACLLWGRKRYILRPLSRGETGETP